MLFRGDEVKDLEGVESGENPVVDPDGSSVRFLLVGVAN